MARKPLTVDRSFCPADLLLVRSLGREVPGLLDATLKQNAGLAALGMFLPIGTVVDVDVPDAPTRATARRANLIRLTD